MKRRIIISGLLALAACTKPAAVPSEADFEANPKLLADWMQKCTTGAYSRLGAEEQSHLCGSAQSAAAAVAAKDLARKHDQLFN